MTNKFVNYNNSVSYGLQEFVTPSFLLYNLDYICKISRRRRLKTHTDLYDLNRFLMMIPFCVQNNFIRE